MAMKISILQKGCCISLFLFMLSSCSSIYEVHYFKDKVSKNYIGGRIPNYYKVEISGYSFLSSSRYVSGYFDQGAVNLYFNEFSQKPNGKLFEDNIFTNENGNELVLIFSTNAKAVTDNIGTIAKNQVVLNSLSSIMEKEKLVESRLVKSKTEMLIMDIDQMTMHIDYYLDGIESLPDNRKKLAIKQLVETLNLKESER